MFGGSAELLLILVVALVVVGPSKLPELIRAFGKGLSEFRRMSSDVKATLEREIERADELKRIGEIKKELFDEADKAKESLTEMAQGVSGQLDQAAREAGMTRPEPLTLDIAEDAPAPREGDAPDAVADTPVQAADAPAAPAPETATGQAGRTAEGTAPDLPATDPTPGADSVERGAAASPPQKEDKPHA